MILEYRCYTLKPGKVPEFLKIYEELGAPVQIPILGEPVVVFTTEVGPLNQVVHVWKYEDFGDRDRRRAELGKHPDWPKYIERALPLFDHMETKVGYPTSWSPVK